jgi:hypothetical protein
MVNMANRCVKIGTRFVETTGVSTYSPTAAFVFGVFTFSASTVIAIS